MHFTRLSLLKHDMNFISRQPQLAILGGIIADLLQPVLLQTSKRLQRRNIIAEEHRMCPSVVPRGDRSVVLRTCSVPQLQLDSDSFKLDNSGREFNADCYLLAVWESVFREALQEARFAYVAVPRDHYFEQQIVVQVRCPYEPRRVVRESLVV